MGVQWYALHSKPRKETQVFKYLQTHAVEIFYPTLKVKPVNPRSATIRAYFPRYLFIHVDLDEIGMNTLRFAPGVNGLVEFGGEAAIIPDNFIFELKRRLARIEAAGGLHLEGLKKGDRVEIVDGPFEGYEAIFDMRLSGEERVQVLLHWLGRDVKVKIDNSAITKRRKVAAG